MYEYKYKYSLVLANYTEATVLSDRMRARNQHLLTWPRSSIATGTWRSDISAAHVDLPLRRVLI